MIWQRFTDLFLTGLSLGANRQHADQPVQCMPHGSCPHDGQVTFKMNQLAAQLAAHAPTEPDRSHWLVLVKAQGLGNGSRIKAYKYTIERPDPNAFPHVYLSRNGISQKGFHTHQMVKSLHTPAYGTFRRLMAEVREHQGLTQAELAKRLGKHQSFVSKYESGERRIDVVEFISVCDALGVEATALFLSIFGATHEYKSSHPSRKRTP